MASNPIQRGRCHRDGLGSVLDKSHVVLTMCLSKPGPWAAGARPAATRVPAGGFRPPARSPKGARRPARRRGLPRTVLRRPGPRPSLICAPRAGGRRRLSRVPRPRGARANPRRPPAAKGDGWRGWSEPPGPPRTAVARLHRWRGQRLRAARAPKGLIARGRSNPGATS